MGRTALAIQLRRSRTALTKTPRRPRRHTILVTVLADHVVRARFLFTRCHGSRPPQLPSRHTPSRPSLFVTTTAAAAAATGTPHSSVVSVLRHRPDSSPPRLRQPPPSSHHSWGRERTADGRLRRPLQPLTPRRRPVLRRPPCGPAAAAAGRTGRVPRRPSRGSSRACVG